MSSSYFDPDGTAKVTVPVKRVGERWKFFYSGDMPVRERTLGELTLNTEQVTDERFEQRVIQELNLKGLDQGIELRVALGDRDTQGLRAGDWPEPCPLGLRVGTERFAPVWLAPVRQTEREPPLSSDMARGGLWLQL